MDEEFIPNILLLDYLAFTELVKEKNIDVYDAYLREISDLQWSPEVVLYVTNAPHFVITTPWNNGEIHEWLNETDFKGRYNYTTAYVIEFEDREDATYFKLCWG